LNFSKIKQKRPLVSFPPSLINNNNNTSLSLIETSSEGRTSGIFAAFGDLLSLLEDDDDSRLVLKNIE